MLLGLLVQISGRACRKYADPDGPPFFFPRSGGSQNKPYLLANLSFFLVIRFFFSFFLKNAFYLKEQPPFLSDCYLQIRLSLFLPRDLITSFVFTAMKRHGLPPLPQICTFEPHISNNQVR